MVQTVANTHFFLYINTNEEVIENIKTVGSFNIRSLIWGYWCIRKAYFIDFFFYLKCKIKGSNSWLMANFEIN